MTPQQSRCLAYINGYIRDNGGVSPSYDEIKDALGLASKSSVGRLVNDLIGAGFLAKAATNVVRARNLFVLKMPPGIISVNGKPHRIQTAEEVYASRTFRPIGEIVKPIVERVEAQRSERKEQLLNQFRGGERTRHETQDAIYAEDLRDA